jgi:transcription antitermination factor NusG
VVCNSYVFGHENKVKVAIESKVRNLGLEEKIGEIKIPTYEDPYLAKDGKKKVRTRKTLPGYVLINMEMDDEAWLVDAVLPESPTLSVHLITSAPDRVRFRSTKSMRFFLKKRPTLPKSVLRQLSSFQQETMSRLLTDPSAISAGVIEECILTRDASCQS